MERFKASWATLRSGSAQQQNEQAQSLIAEVLTSCRQLWLLAPSHRGADEGQPPTEGSSSSAAIITEQWRRGKVSFVCGETLSGVGVYAWLPVFRLV